MSRRISWLLFLVFTSSSSILAQQTGRPALWDISFLSKSPLVYPVATQEPGVNALYFESVPLHGTPTRVFAYYGIPSGQHLPAMVLVHGGDGTAFAEWVRLWNKRGYAAIAIDTCGNEPSVADQEHLWNPPRKRHTFAGPECWEQSFKEADAAIKDQWPFHAVAAAIMANSLLRSWPAIDPDRIGITGISWGGFLTEIVASVDPRFRFAVPVYGCGFIGDDSEWLDDFKKVGQEKAKRWLALWDPSHYLSDVTMPMLWVDGTNDIPYPFDSLDRSYRLPQGPTTLVFRLRMSHGHFNGAMPAEIAAYTDAALKGTSALPVLKRLSKTSAAIDSEIPIAKAELDYTLDDGPWPKRQWQSISAEIDNKQHRLHASVPAKATASFFSIEDARGLRVSSVALISSHLR